MIDNTNIVRPEFLFCAKKIVIPEPFLNEEGL